MSLQINFPKMRNYYFWAIFLSYLTATDSKTPEPERKIFGTLAYRMASKAAESVPSDPVCSPCFSPVVDTGHHNNGLSKTERIAQSPESYSEHGRTTAADQNPRIPRALLRSRKIIG